MAKKRRIVRPTIKNKKKFSNTANRTHVKNVKIGQPRGGIRL